MYRSITPTHRIPDDLLPEYMNFHPDLLEFGEEYVNAIHSIPIKGFFVELWNIMPSSASKAIDLPLWILANRNVQKDAELLRKLDMLFVQMTRYDRGQGRNFFDRAKSLVSRCQVNGRCSVWTMKTTAQLFKAYQEEYLAFESQSKSMRMLPNDIGDDKGEQKADSPKRSKSPNTSKSPKAKRSHCPINRPREVPSPISPKQEVQPPVQTATPSSPKDHTYIYPKAYPKETQVSPTPKGESTVPLHLKLESQKRTIPSLPQFEEEEDGPAARFPVLDLPSWSDNEYSSESEEVYSKEKRDIEIWAQEFMEHESNVLGNFNFMGKRGKPNKTNGRGETFRSSEVREKLRQKKKTSVELCQLSKLMRIGVPYIRRSLLFGDARSKDLSSSCVERQGSMSPHFIEYIQQHGLFDMATVSGCKGLENTDLNNFATYVNRDEPLCASTGRDDDVAEYIEFGNEEESDKEDTFRFGTVVTSGSKRLLGSFDGDSMLEQRASAESQETREGN